MYLAILEAGMRKQVWLLILISVLIAGLAGCSSSAEKKQGDQEMADASGTPTADPVAQTDPAPPTAGNGELPPPDTSTPTDATAQQTPPAPQDNTQTAPAPATADVPPPAPVDVPAAANATPPAPDLTANTPAPVVADQPSEGFTEYTVQQNDTLMKIAFENYGDPYLWKKIYSDNQDRIKDPNQIPPGTSLKIEANRAPASVDRTGEKYLIQPGDTLGKISDTVYGTPTKWRKIWANNKQLIKDPNKIFAGFYLYYTVSAEDKAVMGPAPASQKTQ